MNAAGFFGGARLEPSGPLSAASLNRMQDATQQALPRGGVGTRTRRTTAGTIISAAKPRRGGGTGGVPRHPFRVIYEGVIEGEPNVSVHIDSWLMASLKVDSKITITGLGAAFQFPAEANKLIYVKVTFDAAGVVTAASLEHGDPWATYPHPHGMIGSGTTARQEFAYALVAHTVTKDTNYPGRVSLSDTIEIAQDWTTNMRLCRDCYEGTDSLKLIVPHGAPGPPDITP